MAFMDKLMFWKKTDDFSLPDKPAFGMDAGLGKEPGLPGQEPGFGTPPDMGMPNMDTGLGDQHKPSPFGEPAPQRPAGLEGLNQQPMQQPFQQPQPPQQRQDSNTYMVSKDIEILSSKMDALRAGLESINQRLAHLERIASSGEHEPKRGW